MKEKDFGFKQNDLIFVSYLNENNVKTDFYARLETLNESILIVRTSVNNIILIPINRLLKLKKKGGDNNA